MLIDFSFFASLSSYVYAFFLFMLSRLLSQTCNAEETQSFNEQKCVHKMPKKFVLLCYLQHFHFFKHRGINWRSGYIKELSRVENQENAFFFFKEKLCRLKLRCKSLPEISESDAFNMHVELEYWNLVADDGATFIDDDNKSSLILQGSDRRKWFSIVWAVSSIFVWRHRKRLVTMTKYHQNGTIFE